MPVIAEGGLSATSQFALDGRSLFPTGDAEALANRIDYWIDHPEEREDMGWKYAESTEDYDIGRSIAALIDMFKQATSKPLDK